MALPPPKPQNSFQIDIPPDLHPVYANLARIAHAPAEFVLDFARLLPGRYQGHRDRPGGHVARWR